MVAGKSKLFKNYPNLLWSRTINVAPEKRNSSQIIFTEQPRVTVVERVVNYQQPITLNNVNVAKTGGGGSIIIEPVPVQGGAIANASSLNATYQTSVAQAPMDGGGKLNTVVASAGQNFPMAQVFTGATVAAVSAVTNATNVIDANKAVQSAVLQSISAPANVPATATTAPIVVNTGYSRMTTTNFPLSASMEGGLIALKNPEIEVDLGTALTDSPLKVMPAAEIPLSPGQKGFGGFVPTALAAGGTVPMSGSVIFVINDVESTTQAKVSQLAGPGHNAPQLASFNFVALKTSNNTQNLNGTLGQPQAYDIKSIEASTNFTSSHTEPLVLSVTAQSQSFAEVVLANIEPATGDVYSVRTSYKAAGQFGDFISAGQTVLERFEILEDTGSFEGTLAVGQIYNRIGYYTSLADFDTYWDRVTDGSHESITCGGGYTPDQMMNSISILPGGAFNATDDKATIVKLKDTFQPTVEKNSYYSFRGRFKHGVSTAAPAPIAEGRYDIYIKGDVDSSAIVPRQRTFAQYRTKDYDLAPTLTGALADLSELGRHIGTIEMPVGEIRDVKLDFISSERQKIQVFLVGRKGAFSFKDIGIQTDAETGFSPNHMRLNIRIPSEFIDVPMIFKFEYFDYLGQKADTETQVFPIKFVGDNTVINGTDNLLSGSLYIGNTIGSGIELAGVKSGFIRAIGYDGFLSASRTDKPGGFMMYTGSVLPTSPDNYTGVGLELVEHSESFLRFATAEDVSGKPAGLEVRTPRFFFGGTGQFISGANGNIEISSSNFHLSNAGNVTMQGSITAEAGGTIGGWSIGTTALSSSNNSVMLDSDGPYHISSSGFQIDTAGAITASAGKIASWTINGDDLASTGEHIELKGDASPEIIVTGPSNQHKVRMYYTDDTNYGIQANSGSGIKVFQLGSTNQIAGWVFTDEKLTGGAFEINKSGYLKSGTKWMISSSNADIDPTGFISSSKFKVSADGRVTGSLVQFDGGTIGGWTINTTRLVSPNDRLELDVETTNQIKIAKTSVGSDANDFVRMYYQDVSNYGLQGKEGGNNIFHLGSTNQIAGWTFDNTKLQGGNMIIRKDGTIESDGFVSNQAGSGFRLTAASGGFLEVENARIRGTLSTAVFEKESVNAVGGQLYVANSTTLTGSGQLIADVAQAGIHRATDTTMSVVNVTGFAADEILTAKKITNTGFATEYIKVVSASRNNGSSETDFTGKLFVVRGYSGSTPGASGSLGDLASNAQSYSGSQVIVSTGKIGTGYIRLNANPNDSTTPYIDIVERTGSAIYDIDLKARLGDLSGITDSNFSDDVTGFGLYTQNGYFRGKIEVASLPKPPATEDLILYYPLQDSFLGATGLARMADQSGNGHDSRDHATSLPDTTFISGSNSGPTGGALEFDGNSTVVENRTIQNSLTNDMNLTVAYWAKKEGNISQRCHWHMSDGGNNEVALFMESNSGTNANTSQAIRLMTNNGSEGEVIIDSGSLQLKDVWRHYAVVIPDGGNGLLYIDGVKRGTFSGTNDLGSVIGIEQLLIGADVDTDLDTRNDYFTGSMADFRVYKKALTTSEIESLYSLPTAGVGRTVIEGNRITTGKIRSSNWASSQGSEFDLDAGTFKLGGSENPPFQWDGTNLKVTGSSVVLATPSFFLGGTDQFVSGANSNIEISSSGFHLDRNGNATLSGSITAISGEIGGFTIGLGSLNTANANNSGDITLGSNQLRLSATNSTYRLWAGAAAPTSAPFSVTATGDVTASNIFIDGNARIEGNVTASGIRIENEAVIGETVSIGSANLGNVIFFDDFTTYATIAEMTGSAHGAGDNPKTDGTGHGYFAFRNMNENTNAFVAESNTYLGNGRILKLGDNSGEDEVWLSSNSLIPINSGSVYEYEVRLRKPGATGGTDGQYAGFTVFNSDGTTKRNVSDSDDYSSQHYFVLANSSIGTDFEIHRGYIKGFGDAASTTSTTKTNPTVFESGAENGYFAPMFLASHNDQTGQVEVDYIKVTEFAQGGGATIISGDSITTGKIRSTNFGASSGTELDLNGATFKVGGTSGQRIELDGGNADLKFFNASGTEVLRLDDAVDGTNPGLKIAGAAAIRISGSADVGASKAQFLMTSVNLGSNTAERAGMMVAVSEADDVEDNYNNFIPQGVVSCTGKGGGGTCNALGHLAAAVFRAEATNNNNSAYGIIVSATEGGTYGQAYSVYGESGFLYNAQTILVGFTASFDNKVGYEECGMIVNLDGGVKSGILLQSANNTGIFTHYANRSQATGDLAVPGTDGFRTGINSSNNYVIHNEENGYNIVVVNSSTDQFQLDRALFGTGINFCQLEINYSDSWRMGISHRGHFLHKGSSNDFTFASEAGDTSAGTTRMTIDNGTGVITGDFNDTSDRKLKKNIVDIDKSILNQFMKLRPVDFDWKEHDTPDKGFIAQEVHEIFPELVHGDLDWSPDVDYMSYISQEEWNEMSPDEQKNNSNLVIGKALKSMSVDTNGLVAVLTKVVQDQQKTITDLNDRLKKLENK